MPLTHLLATAFILSLGAMLQTAVGFGIGIVCVPLLLWADWSLPSAVVTVLGAGLVQALVGVVKTRRELVVGKALEIAAAQWLAVPLGVLLMSTLIALGPAVVKQGVGLMLIAILTLRLVVRPTRHETIARPWGWLAGSSGGLLAGAVGMGGPPLVLFALAHDWDKPKFRGFLWLQFVLATPVVLAALVHGVGTHLLVDFATAVLFAPAIALGTWAGLALTSRWKPRQLSVAATLVLYAMGGATLLGPIITRALV